MHEVLCKKYGRTVGRATLALAVIAVVISCGNRLVDVGLVGDGLAETVSSDRHFDEI